MAFTPPEKDRTFTPPEKDRSIAKHFPLTQQFLAGLNDVTALLAAPFEAATGTIEISPKGFEAIGPAETRKRRASGEIGIPGMATEPPEDILGRGGRIAGQTAALGPVVGRVLGFTKAPVGFEGKQMAGQATRLLAQMGETFARSPVATTAAETFFGFTAVRRSRPAACKCSARTWRRRPRADDSSAFGV